MNLSGNTVLITGGATGIGLELSKQLVARGNTVIVTGRNQAKLDAAKLAIPSLVAYQSDASDPEAIVALYRRLTADFPALNVLFNNAGIMRILDFNVERDLEDVTREISINLDGPVMMVQQFLPHLKRQKQAAIVNVSSGLAFVPMPISAVYCATKAALHSLTRSLRMQLKNTSVKVFELAPPTTGTPLLMDGDFADADFSGQSLMSVETLVKHALAGMEKDRLEIRPGQSNALKLMSRVAPEFALRMLSRAGDHATASTKR